MHFRIRGNNVQLVKTVTDPGSGKAVSTPVGSLNISTGKLSENALAALAPEEVAHVRDWLDKRRDLDRQKRRFEAQDLTATLSNVLRWVEESDRAEVAAVADEIQFGLADLRAAISRKIRQSQADAPRGLSAA